MVMAVVDINSALRGRRGERIMIKINLSGIGRLAGAAGAIASGLPWKRFLIVILAVAGIALGTWGVWLVLSSSGKPPAKQAQPAPTIEQRLQRAQQEVGQLNADLKKANDAWAAWEKQACELGAQLTTRSKDLEATQKQIGELKKREKNSSTLLTQIGIRDEQSRLKDGELTALRKERDELKAKLASAPTEIAELRKQLGEQAKKVADAEAAQKQAEARLIEAEKKLEAAKTELAAAGRNATAQLTAAVTKKDAELNTLRGQVEARGNQIDSLASELRKQVETRDMQLAALRKERDELSTKLAATPVCPPPAVAAPPAPVAPRAVVAPVAAPTKPTKFWQDVLVPVRQGSEAGPPAPNVAVNLFVNGKPAFEGFTGADGYARFRVQIPDPAENITTALNLQVLGSCFKRCLWNFSEIFNPYLLGTVIIPSRYEDQEKKKLAILPALVR